MRKTALLASTAVLLATLSTGCIGQMAVSGRVKQFNLEVVEGKWLREAVFLALYFIPVYPFAAGADLIIFNSIEFHTGTNPLTGKPRIAQAGETRRSETPDGSVVVTTLREDGSIDVEVTAPSGERHFVNLSRRGDEAFARDATGRALARVDERGDVASLEGSW